MDDKPYVTVHDVAARYGLHPGTVYDAARTGRIPVKRIGSRLRFDIDELDKYFDEHPGAALRPRAR